MGRITDYTKSLTAGDFAPGVIDGHGADHIARNMNRMTVSQEVAATAAALQAGHVRQAGRIVAARVLVRTPTDQADETHVVNVLKNGVTVLTGAFTFDNTVGGGAWQELTLDLTTVSTALGDSITVATTYTPGLAAVPIAGTLVEIDFETP